MWLVWIAFQPPPQPHSRQSSGFAPNFSYPPPPKQTPPSNGGYPAPPPSGSPPTMSPPPSQPGYSGGQYPPPPSSTSTPPIDQKAIQHNFAAYNQNAALGRLSISSQTPPSAARTEKMPGGAPSHGEFVGATSTNQDDVGTFNGGSYRISHRDTNSLLTVQLAMGCPMVVRPGKRVYFDNSFV